MNTKFMPRTGVAALACLVCASWVMPVHGQSDSKPKPDNTKVNERDRNPGAVTADDQKMNAADQALTAKIRKAVVDDKSMSTYAQNVKIISQDGKVTLKGPVRSKAEVESIVSKAKQVAGADSVVNELSVAP